MYGAPPQQRLKLHDKRGSDGFHQEYEVLTAMAIRDQSTASTPNTAECCVRSHLIGSHTLWKQHLTLSLSASLSALDLGLLSQPTDGLFGGW